MRNGIYAIYQGNEYEAGTKGVNSYFLRSYNSNDVAKGFFLYKGTVYIKDVQRSDLVELYSIATFAEYKNIKLQVLKEDGDKILLSGMVGDYRVFESLGMDMVDRGVYHKWVNKCDLTSLREEKEPI